jgi:23S rRNA (guanosine2251-2'-O)-methyltransferase
VSKSLDRSLVVGAKPALEALERDADRVELVLVQKGRKERALGRVLDACRERGAAFRLAPKAELDRIYPGNHQGVAVRLSEVRFLEVSELAESALEAPLPLVVALDRVQDPGNVGVLARTLFGLGAAGLVLPRRESAHLGAGAVKSSAGTLHRIAVSRPNNLAKSLDFFIEQGFAVCGASMEGDPAPGVELSTPAVLVLGSEEKGLRPGVAKRCQGLLRIPLARGVESLNVAQAGAILAWEWARRRNESRIT